MPARFDRLAALAVGAVLLLGVGGRGGGAPTVRVGLVNAVAAPDVLDPQALAQWVDGGESKLADFVGDQNKPHWPNPATWFVSTPTSRLGHKGMQFGMGAGQGPRHLRVGFTKAIPVGTILLRSNVNAVSVLRPKATYPGNLGNDADWLPATRIKSGELSLWSLPPQTTTRALRLSYVPENGEVQPSGRVLGVTCLAGRFEDFASAATVVTSHRNDLAPLLTNARHDEWTAWHNTDDGAASVVSPEHPEWVLLTWPAPVTVSGLGALWAVFGEAEVQTYEGPSSVHPREAPDSSWKTVTKAKFDHAYPQSAHVDWIDLGRDVTTRALRLRIVRPADEGTHGAMKGKTLGGRRVMLGELMVLGPAASAPAAAQSAMAVHAPIPVTFSLDEPSRVTLVIENAEGVRVRNLVADAPFAAGKHTVWWDGLDESGRIEGPWAGIYEMVGAPVQPGTYRVRGLRHREIDLRYELSVNSPGDPPWWPAAGTTAGGWLADHSSPSAILHLPKTPARLLIGSPVSESGEAIVWTDLSGRKLDGRRWIGGNWTGASHLARDEGPLASSNAEAYAAVVFSDAVRLVALKGTESRTIGSYPLEHAKARIGGLAVRDSLMWVSLPAENALMVVNAADGAIVGKAPATDPRGLAFDSKGRLLVLSGTNLVRHPSMAASAVLAGAGKQKSISLPAPETLAKGLQDPHGLALDATNVAYVSDWGTSHQVKVFGDTGKLLRTIGAPGGAVVGPYDPRRMDRPMGLTVTPDGKLWVAEASQAPKRVSQWSTDGSLLQAFYGPPQYGGGGTLDPYDKSRFYYAEQGAGTGLEFHIDWKQRTSTLKSIYALPTSAKFDVGRAAPQMRIDRDGRSYMTNVFNAQPTGGPRVGGIWLMQDGRAKPVAFMGLARGWSVLAAPRFRERWPAGVTPGSPAVDTLRFAWSDVNDNGDVDPEEVTFDTGPVGSLTVNEKLEFCTASAEVFAPVRFTPSGVPVYEVSAAQKRVPGFYLREVTSGSGQVLAARDGWTVANGGPVRGMRDGKLVWTYPNEWPSQQAGTVSTPPSGETGVLMATARQLGYSVTPKGSDVGEMFAIDGDKGSVYLLTTDGLFVAELFHDVRSTNKTWSMPTATAGASLRDVTLGTEEFWTTITQVRDDGAVYLVAGMNHSSIVRVEGLETSKRIAPWTIKVTAQQLEEARKYRLAREAERIAKIGRDRLVCRMRKTAPVVDGNLQEWGSDDWVTVTDGIGPSHFGKVEAAVSVSGDRLYAAYRGVDGQILSNSGESTTMLFKTGGALDIQLGADPTASPTRKTSVKGDQRLLITRVNGAVRAVIYRAVVDGPKTPVAFSSPWRTVSMDEVRDVTSQISFAVQSNGVELSVPLSVFGLAPKPGMEIRGDIGVLRGNGKQTTQRTYWQNKSTSTVADVPSEVELTPSLWGLWRFEAAPATP